MLHGVRSATRAGYPSALGHAGFPPGSVWAPSRDAACGERGVVNREMAREVGPTPYSANRIGTAMNPANERGAATSRLRLSPLDGGSASVAEPQCPIPNPTDKLSGRPIICDRAGATRNISSACFRYHSGRDHYARVAPARMPQMPVRMLRGSGVPSEPHRPGVGPRRVDGL